MTTLVDRELGNRDCCVSINEMPHLVNLYSLELHSVRLVTVFLAQRQGILAPHVPETSPSSFETFSTHLPDSLRSKFNKRPLAENPTRNLTCTGCEEFANIATRTIVFNTPARVGRLEGRACKTWKLGD